jgi:hypothetical protein
MLFFHHFLNVCLCVALLETSQNINPMVSYSQHIALNFALKKNIDKKYKNKFNIWCH